MAINYKKGTLTVVCKDLIIQLTPYTEHTVRVCVSKSESTYKNEQLAVVTQPNTILYGVREAESRIELTTAALKVCIDQESGTLTYYKIDGTLLSREPYPKEFTSYDLYKSTFSGKVETAPTVDGVKVSAYTNGEVFDRQVYKAKIHFAFSEDEALYGLGSHEEGYGNLRGKNVMLFQENMRIALPYFISTKGYGYLFDCASIMFFHDDGEGSYMWCDCVNELDYYFIAGEHFDEICAEYRVLTGVTPMLPRWAAGFWQSKERYTCGEELEAVASEYRKRNVPLDVIVQDWMSWEEGYWGEKKVDPKRYPNLQETTKRLHEKGIHIVWSIWPNMSGNGENQREFRKAGYLLGNDSNYDAFSEEARAMYWKQAYEGLFKYGIDGWWCDCTEPFGEDWKGKYRLEPHERLAVNGGAFKKYLGADHANAYSLLHSKGIYEGQRKTTNKKRVINLTRSGFVGQHRYGTVVWSGDTSANWKTLHRQINQGLNYSACGEAYWTTDIGGFFAANREPWFWSGEYDKGGDDKGYREIYTRWMQYAAFLPVFRAHGTDTSREIWQFGDKGDLFYDAIEETIRLRYRLIPYFYSLYAAVTFRGEMFMRPLALEFPQDQKLYDKDDQFLVGHELMVCPIVEPMYYEANNKPIVTKKSRSVYLPNGFGWYDFWTNAYYEGGQTIEVVAPIDSIPLFVKAGSIIPMTEVRQCSEESAQAPLEFCIYRGADASFLFYEDSGDGYDYEEDDYSMMAVTWNECNQEVSVVQVAGKHVAMRPYTVKVISHDLLD